MAFEEMRKADLFLFPSFEGGGMVVLEALAHGLPVVCLQYGGPGEMVSTARGSRGSGGPARGDRTGTGYGVAGIGRQPTQEGRDGIRGQTRHRRTPSLECPGASRASMV